MLHVCASSHVFVCVCVCAYVCVHGCVRVHVCMRVCMFVDGGMKHGLSLRSNGIMFCCMGVSPTGMFPKGFVVHFSEKGICVFFD